MKCLACGIPKDTSFNEFYPYPDDAIVDDKPIRPLFVIDCQGADWRVVIVCHHCLHRLQPDLWISDRCWSALSPATPFEKLPRPVDDKSRRFDAESYASEFEEV